MIELIADLGESFFEDLIIQKSGLKFVQQCFAAPEQILFLFIQALLSLGNLVIVSGQVFLVFS